MDFTELLMIVMRGDEPLDARCKREARMALQDAPDCDQVRDKILTVEQAPRFLLAESLKDRVGNLIEDVEAWDLGHGRVSKSGTGIAKTLVQRAFEEIDWFDVADQYLAIVKEIQRHESGTQH